MGVVSEGGVVVDTVKRTTVLYLPKESRDWPEEEWDEAARWERQALEDRPAVVNAQRKIQWGSDPRIETDYTEFASVRKAHISDIQI